MTDSNVTKFYPKNAADNPDFVLEQAVGVYEGVLVIGWNKEGGFEVRGSGLSHQECLWMVSLFQKKLLDGDYTYE